MDSRDSRDSEDSEGSEGSEDSDDAADSEDSEDSEDSGGSDDDSEDPETMTALGANAVSERARAGDAAALFTQGTREPLDAAAFEDNWDRQGPHMAASQAAHLAYLKNKGMVSLTSAASKGYVNAMEAIGDVHYKSSDFEDARFWFAKSAALDSPSGMFKLAQSLESGEGGLKLDAEEAAVLYRRAAGSGHAGAASNLRFMREVGRGVVRSKQFALMALRKAAENGKASACTTLARAMYINQPYARTVGLIEDVLAKTMCSTDVHTTTMANILWGDIEHSLGDPNKTPTDGFVYASIVEWFKRAELAGAGLGTTAFLEMSQIASVGDRYCCNVGCEVVGHRQDFKICPKCKFYRCSGSACQKADWTAGGHRDACCTHQSNFDQRS